MNVLKGNDQGPNFQCINLLLLTTTECVRPSEPRAKWTFYGATRTNYLITFYDNHVINIIMMKT